MTRTSLVSVALVAAFLLLLGSAPASAATPALEERITVALEDADPQDALRSFSQLTGLRFAVAPGLAARFTGTLRNVRVRTALDVFCETVGCVWSEVPGTPPSVRVAPLAPPAQRPATVPSTQALAEVITLDLKDAAAKDVLGSFHTMLGGALDLDADLGGEVTLHLVAVPVRAALDAVCAQLSCSWTFDGAAAEPVLRVRKKG